MKRTVYFAALLGLMAGADAVAVGPIADIAARKPLRPVAGQLLAARKRVPSVKGRLPTRGKLPSVIVSALPAPEIPAPARLPLR